MGSVLCVLLRDAGLFIAAFVDQHAIAKLARFSRRKRVAPIMLRVLVEITETEWICGKQTVTPGVPIGGMLKTCRIIEDRNSELLSIDHSIDVHPVRALAPDLRF